MTLKDLFERVPKEDYDKILIHSDGKGWSNIWFKNEKNDSAIVLYDENNAIFTDDKE